MVLLSTDRSRNSRGLALITVMMIVVVLLILIGALLGFSADDLKSVSYTGLDNRALYAADAGIEAFIVEAEQDTAGFSSFPQPFTNTLVGPDGTARYTVTINQKKTVNGLYYLWVTSQGKSPDGNVRSVDAVLAQASFAGNSLIVMSNPNDVYLPSCMTQYNGPIDLEGTTAHPIRLDWKDGCAPVFTDNITLHGPSGSTVYYNNGSSNVNPSTNADWLSVDGLGSSGVHSSTQNIVFPPSTGSATMANVALMGSSGSTLPSEASKTVYVNNAVATGGNGSLSSGIYVQGDANITMTASAKGSSPSTQTILIAPVAGDGNSVTQQISVLVNFTTNTTKFTNTSTGLVATYTGVPSGAPGNGANGVIFVNGDVKSASGSVNGQYTIAVPDNGTQNNNITVTNNISYHDDPRVSGSTSTDMLGLYANNVFVSESKAPNDLTIMAAIFAGNGAEIASNPSNDGSFRVDPYVNSSDPLKGTLHFYGSLAEVVYGATYIYDQSSHTVTNDWSKDYKYDPRFKTAAPPGWPPKADYFVLAWTDDGAR
jgi:Tfp pilus assembly protein PilV